MDAKESAEYQASLLEEHAAEDLTEANRIRRDAGLIGPDENSPATPTAPV